MNYYKIEVNNRYGPVQAYIIRIGLYDREGKPYYKAIEIVNGVNVPERVGRNSYPYKSDAVTDLLLAQKICIVKLFKLK